MYSIVSDLRNMPAELLDSSDANIKEYAAILVAMQKRAICLRKEIKYSSAAIHNLDMNMPLARGVQYLKALRDINIHTQIINNSRNGLAMIYNKFRGILREYPVFGILTLHNRTYITARDLRMAI